MEIITELVHVKEYSDVQYTEPWYKFDDYVLKEVPEFEWSFEDLLKIKNKNLKD